MFPQVLHTQKERNRERKRTVAAVKETEKPPHCIAKRPKLTNDVSVETKAYPEYLFRHKFSLLVVGLTEWIVLFTRARNLGEYGGTTVRGRVATKSHLSERKFSLFVAFQSLKRIFGKLTQSLTMCWFLRILWPKQQIAFSLPFSVYSRAA